MKMGWTCCETKRGPVNSQDVSMEAPNNETKPREAKTEVDYTRINKAKIVKRIVLTQVAADILLHDGNKIKLGLQEDK